MLSKQGAYSKRKAYSKAMFAPNRKESAATLAVCAGVGRLSTFPSGQYPTTASETRQALRQVFLGN